MTWHVGEVDGEVERVGDEEGEDGGDGEEKDEVAVVELCVEEEDVVAEVLSEDDVTKESRLAGVVEVVLLW